MLSAIVLTLLQADIGDVLSAYDLVWSTPSADASGSVPLGNGEVGANVWIEPSGDLVLLLARHDTHSSASRLLKPGRLRVSFDPPPSGKFEQRLNLLAGRLEIRWGDLELEVFAEPDTPHFRVVGRGALPRAVRARLETWRTSARRLEGEELSSSWTMRGAPDAVPVLEEPDWLPLQDAAEHGGTASASSILSLHVNGESVIPYTFRHQGLGALFEERLDPLSHLTFGVLIHGSGFSTADHALLTARDAREFELGIVALRPIQTQDPAEVAIWINDALEQVTTPAAEARRATAAHWEAFWNRSWIFVSGDPAPSFRLPAFEAGTPRLGFDSNGENRWEGEFARARILSPAPDAAALVRFAAERPERIVRDLEVEHSGPSRGPRSLAVEAWLRREPSGRPARIVDWITAGGSDGFLLDTHPGRDLRWIVGARTLAAPGAWPDDGAWHHVAATYDESNGAMGIWLDGAQVAAVPGAEPGPHSRVTQAYVLQRWVTACQGRGAFPIKFNGGLFTVEPKHAGGPDLDADWRRWGDCFWWQNTRLPYYPMLAAGDWDLMSPLFDFYARVLPLCRARAKLYYGAEGAYFPETITPFGTYANGDYGWDRAGHEPSEVLCPWWQWEWNQGLELLDLMLLRLAHTGGYVFARDELLPMARDVLAWFDSRFPRDERGILRITPTQALETHWHGVVNDMPCVAGLHSVLPRLRALPEAWTTPADRALWERLAAALPPLPVREENGARLLAPAQEYDPSRQNVETPELYATFPFRLAALGGNPERLALAREAYARRHDRQTNGWTQDGVFAARLGLTEEARANLLAKVANSHPGFRFPATWGPNFDWLPDQCHGANLQLLLQEMLLQTDGDRILLFPAWPKDWDVRFRLHAPRGTVVEACLEAGELRSLSVTPESRRADLVNLLD